MTNLTKAPLAGVAVVETVVPGVELESALPAWMPVIDFDAMQHQQQQGVQTSAGVAQRGGDRATSLQTTEWAQRQAGVDEQASAAGQQTQQGQGQQQGAPDDQAQLASAKASPNEAQPLQTIREAQEKLGVDGQAPVNAQQQQQGQQGRQTTQPSGRPTGEIIQWLVPELLPGATRTIRVTAVVTDAGALGSCLVARYQPTLCTAVAAVQPTLQLRKEQVRSGEAGEYAYLCDPITYRYVVTNTGSGVAMNVTIRTSWPKASWRRRDSAP